MLRIDDFLWRVNYFWLDILSKIVQTYANFGWQPSLTVTVPLLHTFELKVWIKEIRLSSEGNAIDDSCVNRVLPNHSNKTYTIGL